MPTSLHKGKKIVAMIPARMGSERLPMKNLALLKGRPLIYYAIQAAKKANVFSRIVINSEDLLFAKIARRYGVEFYQRPKQWASSQARSDFVVHDFLQNNPCDIVVWVNPISPLQTAGEIKKIVKYFLAQGLDSLITVSLKQVHCLYKGGAINFKMKATFARTQELTPIEAFVYSVMIWRRDEFMRTFQSKGHALFCGKFAVFPVSKPSAIIIKKKVDLMLAESLLDAINREKGYRIKYDKVLTSSRIKGFNKDE